MIIIKNFELEIERAKKEVIEENRKQYILNYKEKYGDGAVPEPPKEEITPKAWFTAIWDTGFVVADFEKLRKLPKRKREKILALGGIGCLTK